jgi:DNA-binding transcriptional ArsR family regulator
VGARRRPLALARRSLRPRPPDRADTATRPGEEPQALQVLAEPLSGRILDRLQRGGPASSRALSRALGEGAGSVRAQLGRLAGHGFVEEDRARSRPRARVWRIVAADLRLPQVERTEESDRVARSWFEPSLTALARFVERRDAWAGSATLSLAALTLTKAELERLGAEYIALVQRYGRPVEEAPTDARPATALLFAFPTDDA